MTFALARVLHSRRKIEEVLTFLRPRGMRRRAREREKTNTAINIVQIYRSVHLQ